MQLNSKRTLDSILDTLISIQYPSCDRFRYDKELINIKQEDYYTINQYSLAIHQVFTKYCLCANLKPQEQTQREEEHFFRGLHAYTKTEMCKLNKQIKKSIINTIDSIEESLLRDHIVLTIQKQQRDQIKSSQ